MCGYNTAYTILFLTVHPKPKDCAEVLANGVTTSGVYAIYPDGEGDPFFVFCDMDTDNGGWTVRNENYRKVKS